MTKTIDFQGIISLEPSLVDQLRSYLQEKESRVSLSILNAIQLLSHESLPTALPYTSSQYIKLSDAIEVFGKNIQKITTKEQSLVSKDWETAVRQINLSLWEYVEILEGAGTELFQQLKQVGFEQWQPELIAVVGSINELLIHRMEDLGWKIRRLEELLKEYRRICNMHEGAKSFLRKLLFFWKSPLDRSVLSHIRRSRKFLLIQYRSFHQRYDEYIKLKSKIEESSRKFQGYHVFKSLEQNEQLQLQQLYELLKLWELNNKEKRLPVSEPVRALRSSFSIEKVSILFQDYYHSLKEMLFKKSRSFKQDPKELFQEDASKQMVSEEINGFRAELHTLGAMIANYREFFLRTHPNPYVRTRWGFAEWIVGPEPVQTRNLLNLVYEIEVLDKLFEHLNEALNRGPQAYDDVHLTAQYREIQYLLHEMGQPLTSRNIMRNRAERLLQLVQQMDELGSFNPDIVVDVSNALSKALRIDWQYHVLFDISSFQQIMAIHQGIVAPLDDRHHLNRFNKFKTIIQQIQNWVKNRDAYKHTQEIEIEINDLKGYLQDFLGHVKRISAEDNKSPDTAKLIEDAGKQLLEYRYLFARCFHFLQQHPPEGKLIRNQLLFVDQYFEAVDSTLHNF